MTKTPVALELLVRSGNYQALTAFAAAKAVTIQDYYHYELKLTEARIYHLLHLIFENLEHDFNPDNITSLRQFADYWNHTDNEALLCDLLDVALVIIESENESAVRLRALDFFKINNIIWAMRRNLTNLEIGQRMVMLINSAYDLLLSPHEITAEQIAFYFPLIDQWCSLVNTKPIVDTAIEELVADWNWRLDDLDWQWLEALVPVLVAATNAKWVSECFYQHCYAHNESGKDLYWKLVKHCLIEDFPDNGLRADLREALFFLETSSDCMGVADAMLELLADKIDDRVKAEVNQKILQWFELGRIDLIEKVYRCRVKLYDLEKLRTQLWSLLRTAVNTENYALLNFMLSLPADFLLYPQNNIDPEMADLLMAYACVNLGDVNNQEPNTLIEQEQQKD